MSRTLRPLAALAMVAVISAGCGGTRSSTGSGGGTNAASPHAKAVKFAECMRAKGVSAFPDPDATGALTIDAVANGLVAGHELCGVRAGRTAPARKHLVRRNRSVALPPLVSAKGRRPG